ncbi:carbohydrate ABC transporter permease [Mobiluncus mulieris]|uniref:Maltose/maltodextrin transport system permease protein n=2 Tax=Mobiluncus mulieris TaxID=2052 RepID=E0QT99_9ACTO|nr:sugar ABC transporter permease [Mobiluncus mulieris]EEJ53544.1 ABC transporter, permease protein [Mobiluncus mulieris ATCC 35243]EEZ91434.1 ABC transporter, permease protein [Mobiluncus mulieris 28-1]EFM45225.1 ABC transporter, permease protein [Mobiluncus mulieris ATCC 35239]EFN93956.1 ABC transporter, permease protein [Mobiluncus mulieris FB024-16]MCU9969558.1 sugar ABC transporter permease [Mobiluncus mulieris]
MDATLTSKREARLRKKLGKDYVSPSPYSLKAAFQEGDGLTKASAVVFGLGNLAHRQIVKGLLFLILEIGFFVFLFTNGLGFLTKLPGLGDQKQGKVLVDGYWQYTAGDNSVVILLYGVATILIILAFVGLWNLSVRSAYKAQMLAKTHNRVPSLREDIAQMLDGRAHIGFLFLPTLGILTFSVLPLIFMISMAFTSYDHNNLVLFDWVGLKNFAAIFTNATGTVNLRIFGSVLVWTLVWAIFATFLNFFLGMFMAMLINRKTTRFKNFWRACFSMSIAVPQFVSLLVINLMLQPQGAINRLLLDWGWINEALPFFTNATWARVTVIIVNLWVGIPFTIMQITGILQNIPADQYEAAKIDGANNWVIFRKITMPYIIFVLTPYLITTFTGNVNNFNVIYLLSGGAPVPVGDSAGKTDLLITWLYKLTVDKNDYNLGAVIGIMTFIVLAVVSLITYRRSGSFKNEEAFR